jgi:hypothetical protein
MAVQLTGIQIHAQLSFITLAHLTKERLSNRVPVSITSTTRFTRMFKQLSESDQQAVLEAMKYVSSTVDEFEFQTRLGITRQELEDVMKQWPELDDSSEGSITAISINNSLNEVVNGLDIGESRWRSHFSLTRNEMGQVYKKWLALGFSNGGIR